MAGMIDAMGAKNEADLGPDDMAGMPVDDRAELQGSGSGITCGAVSCDFNKDNKCSTDPEISAGGACMTYSKENYKGGDGGGAQAEEAQGQDAEGSQAGDAGGAGEGEAAGEAGKSAKGIMNAMKKKRQRA